MIYTRYSIHHLDLSRNVAPIETFGDAAHYFVFWYKSIPLGEVYVFFKEPVSDVTFWGECMKAISSTLRMYAIQKKALAILDTLHADPFSIRKVCEHLIADLHPEPPPEVCDLSVVVCTRNRPGDLRNCLRALQHQHSRPAEIIVVDNASQTDDTRKVALEFKALYIREDTPGLDVARNTGARAAGSSIVAYTDDDTTPDPYWSYRVWETFRDPSIAAMTGLVIAASLETEAEVIFEKHWPFNRGYLQKIFDNEFFRSTRSDCPPVWKIGAGANMAFRKVVFQEAGYFDERLDVGAAGCSGDSELWYRLLARGRSIQYNPLAVVHHKHRDSMLALQKQLYSYMRGFTVAILIQYQRFGHRGNLRHLFANLLPYYLRRLKTGFPHYRFQHKTLFSELRGILSGFIYYFRHRHTDSKINSYDSY